MPHFIPFDVRPQPIDELTGGFDALNETTNFDDRGLSPISGEGVFKPQDIDAKGSVIVGDNHFKPGNGGDAITGEGRPMNIWTTAGASNFEDRIVGDYEANDAVFGMRENITVTAGPGDTRFITETFEPAPGMDSFGESLNPILEVGSTAGTGGTSFMTGQFDVPMDDIAI